MFQHNNASSAGLLKAMSYIRHQSTIDWFDFELFLDYR